MSSHDSNPGQPGRGREGVLPEGKPAEMKAPRAEREGEEEQITSSRRRSSPAVRLAAWMLALVILLLVLGWGLSSVL